MSQIACELQEVSVSLGGTPALRNVSLRATQGELLGLFGHNGAGKSTLLRAILGLVPLQSGQIWVDGVLSTHSSLRQLRRRIGYVPQVLNVDLGVPVTAWDVAMMGQYAQVTPGRFPTREHLEATSRALQRMGVLHLAHKPFGHLSGGQQQRVLLARAIASAPYLLLMDEPTGSVDWQFAQQLTCLIREVHEANALTTIIVSHDAPFLAGLCDRVMLIERGQMLGEMPGRDFLKYIEHG